MSVEVEIKMIASSASVSDNDEFSDARVPPLFKICNLVR
jgi:hypothetical protein